MKYRTDIKFSAYFTAEFEANSEQEAIEKARDLFRDKKFDDDIDEIETWSLYVEDENGNEITK